VVCPYLQVFGDKTELLIDREAELRTLIALNKAGFGAQVRAASPPCRQQLHCA
jgi:hypothetical protein